MYPRARTFHCSLEVINEEYMIDKARDKVRDEVLEHSTYTRRARGRGHSGVLTARGLCGGRRR
jgi:hypothetical protein